MNWSRNAWSIWNNWDETLNPSNINISLSLPAKEYLAKKGYERKYGARPLNRLIQKEIKEPLAEEILFGKLKKGGHVFIELKKEKIHFKISN